MDKELHPIDQIIEERCPKLMRIKLFWSLVRPTIYKVFKYQTAKNITDDAKLPNKTLVNLRFFKYIPTKTAIDRAK